VVDTFNIQNEQSTPFILFVSSPKAHFNMSRSFVEVLPNLKQSFIYTCCSLTSELS